MADIALSKKDEVFLKVKCEPSLAQELSDHFSFEVPGAKFHPLYKARMWDGKVKLFSMFTQELYVGLKDYLEHFCQERDYTIDYENYMQEADAATYDIVRKFCEDLNLGSKGKPIEIRDYQIDAVYQAITDARRLLLSPTGSGKSLIIYCLLRWHERFNRKQLIIVPTTSLVEQMYSDFQDYSCLNGWKTSEHCHRIYGGHEKSNEYDIVISTLIDEDRYY
jgi:CRISPR/Cas system-associated endonuclease/helicase Cas3